MRRLTDLADRLARGQHRLRFMQLPDELLRAVLLAFHREVSLPNSEKGHGRLNSHNARLGFWGALRCGVFPKQCAGAPSQLPNHLDLIVNLDYARDSLRAFDRGLPFIKCANPAGKNDRVSAYINADAP